MFLVGDFDGGWGRVWKEIEGKVGVVWFNYIVCIMILFRVIKKFSKYVYEDWNFKF